METSMTLHSTSHVLLSICRCIQTPLALCYLLQDTARAFGGFSEWTFSIGGRVRFVRELMYRRHKLWSSWDLSTGIWETWRAAETAAQLCVNPGAVFSLLWFLVSHKYKAYCPSYSSLLQSQDLLYHIIYSIILIYLYLYILSIGPEITVEHNWTSAWICPPKELRDEPLGVHCGEMPEHKCTESTSNIPPYQLRYSYKVVKKERLQIKVVRKMW
jgi:hypothetical protein